MAKKLFITGTGTDVGKTYISALITKKLKDNGINPAYYKAAMSGNCTDKDGQIIPGDALYVKEVSKINQPLHTMCKYLYKAAFSPHLAAKIEKNPLNMDAVISGLRSLDSHYDYITLEGSGGIICPLRFDSEKIFLEDFISAINASCIIVSDSGLGSINATVLTAQYMLSKGIKISGLIFNNFIPDNTLHNDNVYMCQKLTGLKTLALIEKNDNDIHISLNELLSLYE